jgi:hypothetical protein
LKKNVGFYTTRPMDGNVYLPAGYHARRQYLYTKLVQRAWRPAMLAALQVCVTEIPTDRSIDQATGVHYVRTKRTLLCPGGFWSAFGGVRCMA